MTRNSVRRVSRLRIVAAFTGLVMALSGLTVAQSLTAPSASANVALQFDAGNIINDALFYDGYAMNEQQVQAFLNQKVPNCQIGSVYTPGAPYGSSRIGPSCLKNYSASTASRPANAYCMGYDGRLNETAAQMITRVGIACGISQKVLLVMLEKEQSLITDSWPLQRQFDVAMGYACPDSGPNNSANCDPTQTGFSQQVYRAAWQYKVYLANPTSFNYRPFQVNTILWNPERSCGSSQVYIANWATAALYIYTPYRPNTAALLAGWGTGDSCSSYGNRNFFNFYTTWFGSTQHNGEAQIQNLYASLGGASGFMGAAESDYLLMTNTNGAGIGRSYAGGSIYWTAHFGARYVYGDIRSRYFFNGGAEGALGWPDSNPVVITQRGGGVGQSFQHGSIFLANGGTPLAVTGGMRTEYFRLGGAAGVLGWPNSEVQTLQGGHGQSFAGGSIFQKLSGVAFTVTGEYQEAFFGAGSVTGSLGWPVSQVIPIAQNGGGGGQAFEGGSLYSSSAGAFQVAGTIRDAYFALNGAAGVLGWPLADQQCDEATGQCAQRFQGGDIIWSASGGARIGAIDIEQLREQLLGTDQDLGSPVSGLIAIPQNGGGRAQVFEHASVYSSTRGAFAVSGAIRDQYFAVNGAAGQLGWPVSGRSAVSGGFSQAFSEGTIISSAQGTFVLRPSAAVAYEAAGGVGGVLGAPVTNELVIGAPRPGFGQVFEHGSLFWSATTAPAPVTGNIRDAYFARGGAAGQLGYPAGLMQCSGDSAECSQPFQGGTIFWSATSGAVVR